MKDPTDTRRKETIKIRADINAKETKETIAKINKAKSWSFKKINKIDKPLARFIKKQRVVPVHQPQASSIVHRTWTGNSFHT